MRALALATLLGLASTNLDAQLRPEAAVSWVRASDDRVELGAGITGVTGSYLRATLRVSADVWSSTDTIKVRAEYVMRFLFDPISETRWALSLGAGFGYRDRVYLVALADLEGPRRAGVRPAVQLALGGGARAGVVLRRARANRR